MNVYFILPGEGTKLVPVEMYILSVVDIVDEVLLEACETELWMDEINEVVEVSDEVVDVSVEMVDVSVEVDEVVNVLIDVDLVLVLKVEVEVVLEVEVEVEADLDVDVVLVLVEVEVELVDVLPELGGQQYNGKSALEWS